MYLAGVDGCRRGWIAILLDTDTRILGSKIFASARELFDATRTYAVVAIDIPIGLTNGGSRLCDVAARRLLGPKRASSVFPAPIRPVLEAATYQEGLAISNSVQECGISKQGWAIYPKIREVDDCLSSDEELRKRVCEVHPEVTFAAWNHSPIVEPKKSSVGAAIRRRLIDEHFGAHAFESVRHRYIRKDVADDDIADAFASLWTAERIANGTAEQIPVVPAFDDSGLPMRIVY